MSEWFQLNGHIVVNVFNDKYYCNLNYTWSPPDITYSYINTCFMETIHYTSFFLNKMKCDLYMAEEIMITIWSNSKAQDKCKIAEG